MKKIICSLFLVGFLITLIIPQMAYAADNNAEWSDISISDNEFEEILQKNPNNQISTFDSNLIKGHQISISKSNGTLLIAGLTECNQDVIKCGFSKVIIQRRKNSNSSWSDYKTYEDLYNDATSYKLTKSISVTSGYQYRVSCTHYAKKSIFSTQKIDGVSNILTF